MLNSWPVVKFGSLYKEPSRNGLTKPKKVRGEGYKFINMGEIFKFDRMDNIPCERAPLNDKEKVTSLLKVGDLLFARQSLVLSGAGKCSIFLGDEEEVAFESHLIRVRLDSEKVNPEYVYYYFKSPQGRANINTIVEQGAGQAGIRGSDLEKLDFPVPPRELQDYIVECITPCDLKLEINQETNQTLEQMAQSLFKSWFVDFDPVFDNAFASGMAVNDFPEALQNKAISRQQQRQQVLQQIANGELEAKPLPENIQQLFPSEFEQTEDLLIGVDGWAPKGWKLKTIDELNDINPESWTKKNAPDTVKYVDLANAKNGTVLEAVDYSFSEAPSRARRILNKHDIIIGVVRPANRSFAYVNGSGLTGSTGFAVVRAKKENYRAFSYLSLTNDKCITEFARIADGAAYPAIKPDDVAKAICLYSNEDILKTFEKIVGEFLSKKAASEQQSKPLASLRDTLLSKLISGEVQLDDASTF